MSGGGGDIKDSYTDYLKATGLVGDADFGNLDARTAADISNAIYETKSRFPELDLRFVGSVQSRNKRISSGLTDMYMQVYREYNPDASEDELQEAVARQVSDVMRSFDPGEGTIAQSLFVGDANSSEEMLVSGLNGITINEVYGSDYEYFKSVRKNDVDTGWKPQNCYSPKATVDHELGHQIARLVDAHNDPVIQDMYKEFMSVREVDRPGVLSGYAATDIHEFIAESWSEYRNNPTCRDCARIVGDRMIELHEQTQKKLVKVLRR